MNSFWMGSGKAVSKLLREEKKMCLFHCPGEIQRPKQNVIQGVTP